MTRPGICAAVLLLTGCLLQDIDFDGRRCPCATGWTCDEARDLCVRDGSASDAGARDGAGPTDAGPSSPDSALGDDAGRDAGSAADAGPGSDAGADAGGGVDAGADPTACDDVLSGALFCDGFELDLSAWSFETEVMGAAVHRTSPPIYRGVGALRTDTTGGGGKASVTIDLASSIRTGELHLRGYFFVPGTPAIDTVSLMFAGEAATPFAGVAVQIASDGRTQVYVGTEDRIVAGGRAPFPRDRWVCVTLDLDVGMRGNVQAAVDGAEVANERSLDTLPTAGFRRVTAGIEFTTAATATARVYADEIAVSRTALPCD